MPRPIKKAKTKAAKPSMGELPDGASAETVAAPAVALAEPPHGEDAPASTLPPVMQETPEPPPAEPGPGFQRRQRPAPQKPAEGQGPYHGGPRKGPQGSSSQKSYGRVSEDKDHIAATSISIAKLQAMSMTEL